MTRIKIRFVSELWFPARQSSRGGSWARLVPQDQHRWDQGSSDIAAVLALGFPLMLFDTATSVLLTGNGRPGPRLAWCLNGSLAEHSWRLAFYFCYLILDFLHLHFWMHWEMKCKALYCCLDAQMSAKYVSHNTKMVLSSRCAPCPPPAELQTSSDRWETGKGQHRCAAILSVRACTGT